jgi:enoyl-CoA hydratase
VRATGGRVRVEEADGITTVVLDDPAARNALSWELVHALSEAVEQAGDNGSRALVPRTTPPVFCAGGSVDELLAPKVALEEIDRALHALDQAPMPTVAAVDGAAVGAGVTLLLCGDLAVFTPESRFDLRFLDVGRTSGRPRADALRRCARRRGGSPPRAGLAVRCPDDLAAEAGRMARTAASRDPELVSTTKCTMRAASAVDDPAAAIRLARAAALVDGTSGLPGVPGPAARALGATDVVRDQRDRP